MDMMETGKGGGKQKKMTVRVDFTPMVDMLMLLITFFMLCTSLSKPSTMELTMPSNDKNTHEAQKNEAKESHSITIYLTDGNKIFYGNGKPEYDNPNWLKPADWSNTPKGIRYVLQHKQVGDPSTGEAISLPFQDMDIAVKELNRKRQADPKAYPDSIYQSELAAIKSGTINGKKVSTMTVIIKPTDHASYRNLVDILDEMQISYIGTYVIDKLTDQDKALLAKKGIKA
ncbi:MULTISPECIES: ExbD/TolR family protein [Prevotella]|uniref:ExbD/TolR family protein n=1 Tax=Prevotella histicola TaxID=470565 RepID=UPI001CB05317|nr:MULTISPECIES: biopolymer transporter ExbD [Prevotella]MBF1627910.1 biopolymer transporter ExbD [Prevotella sp.]